MTTDQTNQTISPEERAIQEAEAQLAASIAFIQSKGHTLPDHILDTTAWLTIKRYAEKYSLTINTVTNWIARGIIPAEAVRVVPELNDIRLVRDRAYK
ncbi:hypothetical protein GCM10028807_57780 [Spirosoma daeguense]